MAVIEFKTKGVCADRILITVADGKVEGVEFEGGCEGNIQAISRLVVGMKIEDVIRQLKGIDCEGKGTSCPDQLARALETLR